MSCVWKFFFVFVLATTVSAASSQIQIGRFSESNLHGWSEKSFKGNTEYKIVEDSGQKVLQAKSNGTASGFIFEREFDVYENPLLVWNWKIVSTVQGGDYRQKAKDDFAARVYVTFPHWFFPKTTSLNYVWANQMAKDEIQPNAYTANAMMIAVESGNQNAGTWVEVRRNIIEDYRRAFGEDPPRKAVIAIMTDTDNTGGSATAWYSDIVASQQ